MKTQQLLSYPAGEIALVVSGVSLEGIALTGSPFQPRTATRSPDRGSIGASAVLDVVLGLDDQTIHLIEDVDLLRSLRLGDHINASVDLNHRADLNRLDSLAHLSWCAVAAIDSDARLAGRTIGPEHAAVDIALVDDTPIHTIEAVVKRWIEAVIRDDLLISQLQRGVAGRTYWQVDGVGCVPCGATHPPSTGCIGSIHIAASRPRADLLRLIVT